MNEYETQRAEGLTEGMETAPIAHREAVLLAPAEGQPGVVAIIWNDPDETPLQAIHRLNREVIERDERLEKNTGGVSAEMMDELRDALSAARNLLDTAQSAAGYATEARHNADYAADAAADVERDLDTLADQIEAVVEKVEVVR